MRLWLVSSTPGGDAIPDQDELSSFNLRFGANSPVTVSNTIDPFLCDQLLSRNPEYGEPDWQMVRSHCKLLDELVRFAEENRVRIVVRFLSCCRAFLHLDAAQNPDGKDGRRGTAPKDAPDVAQIGDTWAAWFADKDAMAAWPDVAAEGLKCRSLPGCGKISVRYIADLRMLFYWRRLPGAPPSGPWLEIDAAGWTHAVECILAANSHRSRPLPPVAFPLGLTPNLVHDYAPLVWAGGGSFL